MKNIKVVAENCKVLSIDGTLVVTNNEGNIIAKQENILFEQIKQIAEKPATQKMIDILKNSFFDIPKNTELSTRKNNLVEKFEQDLKTEFSNKGETVWGLFSGLTRYTTHTALADKDKNEFNKMFGNVGKKERAIFNELVAIA